MARRRRAAKTPVVLNDPATPRHGGTLNIDRAWRDFKFASSSAKDDINLLCRAAMRKHGVALAEKSTVEEDPRAEPGNFNLKNYKNFVAGVDSRGTEFLLPKEALGLQELELATRI